MNIGIESGNKNHVVDNYYLHEREDRSQLLIVQIYMYLYHPFTPLLYVHACRLFIDFKKAYYKCASTVNLTTRISLAFAWVLFSRGWKLANLSICESLGKGITALNIQYLEAIPRLCICKYDPTPTQNKIVLTASEVCMKCSAVVVAH